MNQSSGNLLDSKNSKLIFVITNIVSALILNEFIKNNVFKRCLINTKTSEIQHMIKVR